MTDSPQMCLSCSERPATSSNGTVPLCSVCAAQVKDSRGVDFEKKAPSKDNVA